MATLTTESARAALKAVEVKASEAYAAFDKMKNDMTAEGIDLMADKEAFEKLDTARKEYSSLASQAKEYELRLGELAAMDGMGSPRGSRAPYAGPEVNRESDRMAEYGIASRFLASDGYKRLEAQHSFETDAGFQAGAPGLSPVEVIQRNELKSMLRSGGFQATTVQGGGAGTNTGVGPFIAFDLKPGYIELLRKTPTLSSMVGEGTTDSDTIEYVEQTSRTNAAIETAETTVAPESAVGFTLRTVNVREIPHFIPVTRRAMQDYGQVTTIINNELVNGLLDRVDTEIATGAGGGQLFTGIYNVSGIGAQALGADTGADAIHKAITQIEIAFLQADYIGMHPNDWQKLRLAKDADGNYILGPAGMAGDRQIWGVPVVTSQAFTAGSPLVGAYKRSATLWMRSGIEVATGLDGNNFTNRMVTMLATMRAGFAVQRAAGFCAVTGF